MNLATGQAHGGHASGDEFSGFENVVGSRYHDHLTGDSGANELTGGFGADALVGGAGRDSVVYRGSEAAVTVNLATGTGTSGDAAGDTFTGYRCP